MLSRLPAAIPYRGHGPSLEPRAPSPSRLAASAPIGDRTRRCRALRRGARAVSALAQSASRLAAPTASRPELRRQLEKLGGSRLPVCLARLTGECSWQTNIGNDVGVEPTTLRLTI